VPRGGSASGRGPSKGRPASTIHQTRPPGPPAIVPRLPGAQGTSVGFPTPGKRAVAACLDRRPARRRASGASRAVNNHWTKGLPPAPPRGGSPPAAAQPRFWEGARGGSRAARNGGAWQRGASQQRGDRSEEEVVAELACGRARALRGQAFDTFSNAAIGVNALLQAFTAASHAPLHALASLECCTCMGTAMTCQSNASTWHACKLAVGGKGT